MSVWDDIKARWSEGWQGLYDKAQRLYAAAIIRSPAEYAPKVRAAIVNLQATREGLERMRALMPPPPYTTPEEQHFADKYAALQERYATLAAGLYSDAAPAAEDGAAGPAVIIVLGLAVGVAGSAWAVAAYNYTAGLRDETALALQELETRAEAMRSGRRLQPSTLQNKRGKASAIVLGALGLVTAGGLWWAFAKPKGNTTDAP